MYLEWKIHMELACLGKLGRSGPWVLLSPGVMGSGSMEVSV